MLGDTDSLHQVIANLLANVREHCPPGTSARVEVSTVGEAPEPAWVQVDVTDDGPGLDPDQLPQATATFG